MKKELTTLIALVLFSLFAYTNVACSGKSDGCRSTNSISDKSINNIYELKAYLEKQTANSPDNPIKVAMKANDIMMLDKIRMVLEEAGKYVNLDLSGNTIKIIKGLSGSESLVGITLPDSVTSIGYGAFDFCSNLASITIPGNVTSISSRAFADCINLTNVTITDSVIYIGDSAFRNCISLSSIIIPNRVKSIGDYAFFDCISLTSVTFQGTISKTYFSVGDQWGSTFPGDLRDKFYVTNATDGMPGTYTRASGGSTWTLQ
jgi:hypothetical protein